MPVLFLIIGAIFFVLIFALQGNATAREMNPPLPKVLKKVLDLARAIANAEGFFRPGTIPQRAHNPGDLKLPANMSPLGYINGHTIFANDKDGWDALYNQIELMRTENSRVYTLDMTFEQVAQKYAEDYFPWLANVTRELGISKDTTLREFFES